MKQTLLLIYLLAATAHCLFCSAYCSPNSCTDATKTKCTNCDAPFVLLNGSCTVGAMSGYEMLAEGSQIISSTASLAGSCSTYTFEGNHYFFDAVYLEYPSIVNVPHYAVRLIFWTILYDEWKISDRVYVELTQTMQTLNVPVMTSYSTAEKLCGLSFRNEWYLKVDLEFPHTSLTEKLNFVIDVYDTNNQYWGTKQYMILLAKCHFACLQCQDATPNLCSSCATGYKISGTVCNQTCLEKYGESNITTICIPCDLYCTQCFLISTNCSACQLSGPYQSYLYNTDCLVACPAGYAEQNSTHTCQPCLEPNCSACSSVDRSICYECNASLTVYWLNYKCLNSCPNGYFEDVSNCTKCDISCKTCSSFPSPCFTCENNYYMYAPLQQCLSVCPIGYFIHLPSRSCLDCASYCVKSTITMALDSLNQTLTITIQFTRPIDFSTFPYQTFQSITEDDPTLELSRFTIKYSIVNNYSYKIVLTPIACINMTNVNFTVAFNPYEKDYYSSDGHVFNTQIYILNETIGWSYLKLPKMNDRDGEFINRFSEINSWINDALGVKFVQQVKKTGIFALLLPGAQLSATILLHNGVPAQNMYEASRFWGSFVFFTVPKWEEDSNLTKYMVTTELQNLLAKPNRLLQTNNFKGKWWRLTRTGHSTYFIFDSYMLCGILVLCWILLAIAKFLKYRRKVTSKTVGIFYNALHRFHEVAFFYLTLNIAIEWLAFSEHKQNNSSFIYISLSISVIAAIYILFYQLYVYYELIPFYTADVKDKLYVEKYSYFLRDLRFEEYRSNSGWSWHHFIRPYNYYVLRCMRLILLLFCIPLFQQYPHGCISVMIIIQSLEIIRFLLTWPFHQTWRNFFTLFMQLTLLSIFIISLLLELNLTTIYNNLNITTDAQIENYFTMGWVGFALIFFYNISFIFYLIIEVVYSCCYTNRYRMEKSRRNYYSKLLSKYEEPQLEDYSGYGELVSRIHDCELSTLAPDKTDKKAIKQLVKKGNLLQKDYDKLETLSIIIEKYQIKETELGNKFQISCEKVPGVFMQLQIDYERENNLLIPIRKKKVIELTADLNLFYYQAMVKMFIAYSSVSTESITLKTYLKIDQNLYKAGVEIPQSPELLQQEIEVKLYNESKERIKLQQLVEGFPVPLKLIEQL